ncbi:MAG: hypothetical protein KF778_08415 [Rhodocyclaceae bacterium]|nr:hypothetical protein [Rhodocyclaceae bacterium]MBX3668410.1 hypothetical protein [Rhodocyclaceae bacterium]
MYAPSPVTYSEGAVPPFWSRFPKFFLFPLQAEPLFHMALLSALEIGCVFTAMFAAGFGFAGGADPLALTRGTMPMTLLLMFAIVAVPWLIFFRYAYKVLEQTARGRLTLAQYQQFSDKEGANRPYKQIAVFLLFGLFEGLVAQNLGEFPALVAHALVMLGLPATVMIIAIDNSVWRAVNPFAVLSIMATLGWAYFALFGCLMLLSIATGGVTLLLFVKLPPLAAFAAANFASMYFSLVGFNLLGYSLYQFHQQLGVDVDVDFSRQTQFSPDMPKPADPIGETIGRMIAQGKVEEALNLAYDDQRGNPHSATSRMRYQRLLVLAGKNDRALRHGSELIAMLLRKMRTDSALEVFEQCRTLDAQFAPPEAWQILPLAEAARRARKYSLALEFMQQFDRRNRGHPDVPAIYLLSAKILCENLHQDEQAKRILKVLIATFPQHVIAEEARRYLSALDKMVHPEAPAKVR